MSLHSVQDTGSGLHICDKSLPRAAKQFVSVIRGLKKQFSSCAVERLFFFSLRDQGNTSEEKITHICPSAAKTVVFCLSCVEAFPILHLSKKLSKCSYATTAVSVLWFPPYQSDFNLVV